MHLKQSGATGLTKLAIILAICGVLAVAINLLPKGFKSDLTLIGQGRTSVVLVHDKNLVASTEMMELLNKIRSDYDSSVDFLAVDIATPDGQKFIREQRARPVDLVIFAKDGKRLQILGGGSGEQAVRAALDATLQQT